MSVPRYYAWLTWLQDAARHVGHDTGQQTLTVHRRLRAASGEISGDVLHHALLAALDTTADTGLLDGAKCAFKVALAEGQETPRHACDVVREHEKLRKK